MRMALAAFRSASDRHIVRGRQSSCAMPRSWHRTARPNPLELSALSVHQKQDHSFATHTIQRTLVSNSLKHPVQFSHSNARLRRDLLTTQIHSSGLLASDSHLPCTRLSSTLLTAASQRLSSYNVVIKPKDLRIITFLTVFTHCSILAATHFSALVRAGYTRAYSQRRS